MAIQSLNWNKRVRIVEVGPRDGLQNEPMNLSTTAKLRLICLLTEAGLSEIEVTSFVSPRWVPMLADAEQVMAELPQAPSCRYSVLVPNLRGYERARQAGAKAINIFVSASEAHSRQNVNRSIVEHMAELGHVVAAAQADQIPVRAYISMVFGCPDEGIVPSRRLETIVTQLLEAGCEEVSLGDTVGWAQPQQVQQLVARLAAVTALDRLALHFHDTRGLGLVNAYAGLQAGITTFDGSVGGLGGCPFAAGATGNVATEELVFLFASLGLDTGVNVDRLCEAATYASQVLGRSLPSRYLQAWQAARK